MSDRDLGFFRAGSRVWYSPQGSDDVCALVEEVMPRMAGGQIAGVDRYGLRLESGEYKLCAPSAVRERGDSAGTLHARQIVRNPDGTYRYVGRIPIHLGFVSADGEPITDRQIEAAQHSGPGFANPPLRARHFDTFDAALRAARMLGFAVRGAS